MASKIDDVLNELKEQGKSIVRLETRLDAIDINLADHMRRTEQNEVMIEDLQKYKWIAIGAISIVSFFSTVIIKFL